MKALPFTAYYEITQDIANRIRRIRKTRKISRKSLAVQSGVSYASLRRFETTGDISLASLVKIALALGLYDDLDALFAKREYRSIEDVINDQED